MKASSIKNYIGIDVSKDTLDISVIRTEYKSIILHFTCSNNLKEIKELKRKLRSNSILLSKSTLIIFEYSGFYGRILLNFLINHKCLVCLESPLQIKKSLGIRRGKSDRIDSKRIADYGFRNRDKLRIWIHPRQTILRLKDLLSLRERLVRTNKAIITPIVELEPFYTKAELKYLNGLNHFAAAGLKRSLTSTELELKKIIKTDSLIKKQLTLLMSIPGIGIINALYLICVTHEFTITNSGRKLASYMGVAPFEYTSGTSLKGKMHVSPFANKKLKGLIHTAAVITIRKNGEFRKYYDRKVAQGKHKMLVLNSVCNKILRRVSSVIRRGTPYVKTLGTRTTRLPRLHST